MTLRYKSTGQPVPETKPYQEPIGHSREVELRDPMLNPHNQELERLAQRREQHVMEAVAPPMPATVYERFTARNADLKRYPGSIERIAARLQNDALQAGLKGERFDPETKLEQYSNDERQKLGMMSLSERDRAEALTELQSGRETK